MAKTMILKETFQRLVLLYLIGRFPDGVFSSFRLQKVLYYGTCGKDLGSKPFTFQRTSHGQYSYSARVVLNEMYADGLLEMEELTGNGICWKSSVLVDMTAVFVNFEAGFPQLAKSIEESVQGYGFMKQPELDERVHADPILRQVPQGGILIKANSESRVATQLSEDVVEELEILLTPGFVPAMAKLTCTVAGTDFDTSKVRTIDSLDALL